MRSLRKRPEVTTKRVNLDVACAKLNAIRGVVENTDLKRSLDSWDKMPAEEKVAYLESTMSSLRSIVYS